jgi:CRP-like cAMP-binding protein
MIDPKHFQTFDIFARMSPAMLKSLAAQGEELSFNAGDTVIQQGKGADRFCGLISGQAELRFMFRDRFLQSDVRFEESVVRHWETVDTPIVLETLSSGDLFGWSSMVGGDTYTASVVCTEQSRVLCVQAEHLRSLLDEEPKMGYFFMDFLADLIATRLDWRTSKLVESWAEAFGSPRVE